MVAPRPLLIVLLGMVLIAAAFVSTRSSGAGDDAGSGRQAATPAPSQKPSTPPSDEASAKRGDAAVATNRDASRPQAPKVSTPEKAERAGLPLPVGRALAQRKVVVLFFRQRGAGDDAATAESVAAVRRDRGRVAVFTDSVRDVADYRLVIGGLGVSQAPSVVVVGPNSEARLLEGYVDAGTLRRYVADALP